MSGCAECIARIDLLVDGELVGSEQEYVRAHMEECADCRRQMDEARALSGQMRQQRLQPAPADLRARLEEMLQAQATAAGPAAARSAAAAGGGVATQPDRPFAVPAPARRPRAVTAWRLPALAAMLAVVAGLVFGSGYLSRRARARSFVQEAIAAQQGLAETALPLDIQSSSPDAIRAWFAPRVSFPFRMPNSGIASSDRDRYALQGGRLVSFHGERAAVLAFRMANETISILIASGKQTQAMGGSTSYSNDIRFHTQDLDHHHVVSWDTHGLTYALVSEQPMMSRGCGSCHEGAPDVMPKRRLLSGVRESACAAGSACRMLAAAAQELRVPKNLEEIEKSIGAGSGAEALVRAPAAAVRLPARAPRGETAALQGRSDL